MDLPQRKINRIPEYDYSTNGAYFITICTRDRRKILSHIVGGGDLTLDTDCVVSGYISITPMTLHRTDMAVYQKLTERNGF